MTTSTTTPTEIEAVYVTPPEVTETWTIEIVNLVNWEDFTEPDITVDLFGEAAIDHCSCETYTLDAYGSVTSASDCGIVWDYDLNDDCDSPATQVDFGLLWTWLYLMLCNWTSGLSLTGCSLLSSVNLSGLVNVTHFAKVTFTGWIGNFCRISLVCLDAIAKLTTRLFNRLHNHCKLLLSLLLLVLLVSGSINSQLHSTYMTNLNSPSTSINMMAST